MRPQTEKLRRNCEVNTALKKIFSSDKYFPPTLGACSQFHVNNYCKDIYLWHDVCITSMSVPLAGIWAVLLEPVWGLCPIKQTCLLYIPVVTHMDARRQAAWTARGLVPDAKQLSSFECFLCERLLERWCIPDALGYMGFESGLCHNCRPAHWRRTTENGW